MERAFQAAGVDSRCLTVDVAPEDLQAAIAGMKSMGFCGAVLAHPHQEAACEWMSRLAGPALMLGEIDVIYQEDGELVGSNSTVRSVTEILARYRELADIRVVILGAGAVARAAALAVGLAGARRITIVARDDSAADKLKESLQKHVGSEIDVQTWADLYRLPPDTDVAVQATSNSGADATGPLMLDYDGFSPGMLLLDAVFNPPRTEFIRRGEQAGCDTIDGLELLVQRASVAFQIWTGVEPDGTVVRDAFEEFLMI